ncbi:competence protein [Streptococcus equi subsp. zooepidemicus]|nr:competence protein [Streptococcus equi]MCD3412317.1 competence protein [Streptococcus equi subsp. zooepidemicus]MCD3452487.1 competence protein [Streptococcus equi subsp. zooepidemicus]MDI6076898.1 competence protein [Streptococcus equi subsp. zooepidemicus]VTS16918.1 competence stimulating peptide [Streptococcus equi subsp. zooepidemicus]HEK9955722.1 competence protein [Streptococcus equi subsp. zooepidemicus]
MEQFKNLSQSELQNTNGGGAWSPIVTVSVPVVLPMKVVKWVAGFFE